MTTTLELTGGYEGTVDMLVDDFYVYLLGECNLAPKTIETYGLALSRLESYCDKPVEDIGSTEVRAFLRLSKYSPRTKANTLSALKAFHKWGALEGHWSLDGVMSVRGPRVIRDPEPSLPPHKARALLSHCSTPAQERVVFLGLLAGLRVSETASVDAGCWRDDRLRFLGKGRKTREVPVHPALARARDRILQTQPSVSTLKSTCRYLGNKIDHPFSSHTLRRTFAVTLSEAGVPREVIGALLGHTPVSITERYAPVRFSELEGAISKLRY